VTIYRHRYSWFTNPNWTKETKISYRYPYESNRWRLTRRNGITKCWFPSKNKFIKSPIISKINEIEKFSLKIFTSSEWVRIFRQFYGLDWIGSMSWWIKCRKPLTIEERRPRLEMIWNDLSQKPVARAVQNVRKRLQACVFKAGGHFEHSMWLTLC